jgi:hypothetical protein
MVDRETWHETVKCKPPEYEMCELLTHELKVKKGWRSGTHYDGILLKNSDKILKWRRVISYQDKK